MVGAERRRRAPSSRKLLSDEAERLKHGAGPALRDALTPVTWRSSRTWAGLAFWGLCGVCVWLCVADLVAFAVGLTETRHLVAPGDNSLGVAGRLLVSMLAAGGLLLTCAFLTCWHRQWLRLDAEGFTHSGLRTFRRTPKSYLWAQCGAFRVVELPASEFGSVSRLETVYDGTRFVPDFDTFGDAHDLCVILNAYRTAFSDEVAVSEPPAPRATSSPVDLRSAEALRIIDAGQPNVVAALGESTWQPTMFKAYAELVAITLCAVGFMALFVWAALAERRLVMTAFAVVVALPCVLAVTWSVFGVVNRSSVQLGAAGIRIGGRRAIAWAARPRFYRWDECAPFELHYIDGDPGRWVVRSKARGRRLQFDGEFGDPADLVVILNAYRANYSAVELR